jgi:hypothetical protein
MASPPRFGAGRGCAKRGVKTQSHPRRHPPELKLVWHVPHAFPKTHRRSDGVAERCGDAAWAIRPHADPNAAPHAESFSNVKIVAVAAPCPIKYIQSIHAETKMASPPRFCPARSGVAHGQGPAPALHPRPWPLLSASRTRLGATWSRPRGGGVILVMHRVGVACCR